MDHLLNKQQEGALGLHRKVSLTWAAGSEPAMAARPPARRVLIQEWGWEENMVSTQEHPCEAWAGKEGHLSAPGAIRQGRQPGTPPQDPSPATLSLSTPHAWAPCDFVTTHSLEGDALPSPHLLHPQASPWPHGGPSRTLTFL